MCDVLSMIKRCEVWNIVRVDRDWAGRKVFFVVYVAKVLRWLKVHYKLAMGGAPQVAMRVALQIWQIVFASQTLQVFCFCFANPSGFSFGPSQKGTICNSDWPRLTLFWHDIKYVTSTSKQTHCVLMDIQMLWQPYCNTCRFVFLTLLRSN